ncbi:MAG: hypothetical protein ACR2LM_02090 [Pyrinomonadaceae bacterium]
MKSSVHAQSDSVVGEALVWTSARTRETFPDDCLLPNIYCDERRGAREPSFFFPGQRELTYCGSPYCE